MRNELKHMAAKGAGAIVNTASLAGLRSIKNQSAYVSSKHALVGLTKNAAVEYAARGVRVNAICPGGIVTGMLTDALAVSGTNEPEVTQAMKDAAALHPMNRLGQASEIADAAVFLCSDKAAFITGTMLSVDGGWAAI
jgi:NAD(P)-dependent dehydrogenase (short-subunit alcohol dehydrogenase family)